ncbi:NAD(P)H azoreductase [Verrucomicrobia bacterium]|nr:NAD(P)H azoreductase [Verrucomicrobiota bacterium]
MILITGATGNNGRELIRQLSAAGQAVRALVRNLADAAILKTHNAELATGDFDHPETLDAALRGVAKAFLLTPVAERFVKWQTTFIEACQCAKVKHLVKFSGMGADPRSGAELLRLHAQTDDVLRKSGLPFTILQPNSFHQNILSSADTIKTQGKFYWPLKNGAQSTVDIRDINAVATKVFTSPGHEGKAYVITGPEALTFQQAAEKLSSVLGRQIQYVDVPLSAAADGMRKSGMPEWNVRTVTELLGYFASGAAATVTDTVPRLLGRPAISFEQFVRDNRAAFLP